MPEQPRAERHPGGAGRLRNAGLRLAARALVVVLTLAAALPVGSGTWAAELSPSDREHYKNAFLHFDRGNHRDARLHARRAKDQLGAKVVQWLDLTRSGSGASFNEARAFLERNPHWPRLSKLRLNLEANMPRRWPDRDILAWFKAHPPTGVEGAMTFARALTRSGRTGEARALLRETWRSGRFGREQEKRFRDAHLAAVTRDDSRARLDNLLWRRAPKTALRLARRLGPGYVALAEARIALWNRTPGVDGALSRVPRALMGNAGLVYDRALWRKRKDRYDGVVELLRPLDGNQPHAERWWPLRRWAAYEALDRRQPKTAYAIASRHGLESGPSFAEGEWLAGWTALRQLKDPQRAYRHFTRLYYGSASPISQGRGGYWAAEAAKAMGRDDWAQRWYAASAEQSTSFYGQLAASRIGQPVSLRFDERAQPTPAERGAFRQRELVRIVRLLGELRQKDLQGTFLRHLGQSAASPKELTLAAELANEVGRPDIAVWSAKQLRNEGLLMPELLFPLPLQPRSRMVEPALVLAVIRQESQFDPTAVSHAGARGLMQLMPATAKRVAARNGLRYDKGRLTRDPDYNMRLGISYLAGLLDSFNGSHVMALAGYNAGPSRVNRWVAAHGDPRRPDVDPIAWIEQIPFNETRNYVMRVLEGLVVYRKRLGTGIVELPLGPATAQRPAAAE